jgi:hypothetical protein
MNTGIYVGVISNPEDARRPLDVYLTAGGRTIIWDSGMRFGWTR